MELTEEETQVIDLPKIEWSKECFHLTLEYIQIYKYMFVCMHVYVQHAPCTHSNIYTFKYIYVCVCTYGETHIYTHVYLPL